MHIRLGEMKREVLSELTFKTKYRKKTVIKDQDLNVVIFIPISPDEEHREETLAHTSVEETTFEKEKVLELHLVKPLIETPIEIGFNIDKDVIIPSQASPFNYVFLIKYNPKHSTKVAFLDVEKSIHPTLVTISSMIKDILKNVPFMEFIKPELIKKYDVEKSINTEVVPSTRVLNYIVHPRLTFRQPYNIKHRDMDKEITVKTSESLSFISSVEPSHIGTLIEQKDVLERFFNLALSRMIIDRPLLIFAKKPKNERFEYIELLKRLLRELYRVYVGGLPNPADLRTSFEEVKLDVKAGKYIYVVDVDEVFSDEIEGDITRYIVDRLRELYSQGLGFLIFYGSKESLDNIKSLRIRNTSLWYRTIPSGRFFGKVLQPVEISVWEDPKTYNLANLVWGKVLDFEHIEENVDLDSYAVMLEEEFYRRIMELASDPNMIIKVEPSKRDKEKLDGETLLHYGIKAFVVKYLVEHENIPVHNIFTEYGIGNIVLDVFVKHPKHGDLAIEVETLYGTVLPLLKLRKTIDSRLSKGLKLWIVIPNIQFILFLRDLAILRSIYRKKYLDSIEFFTLDIYSQKLIPFSEIIEKLRQ